MPAGDAFSPGQQADLKRALDHAEREAGRPFSLYVGPLDGGRATAVALHARLRAAAESVLVAVDPASRTVEIVTGAGARRDLDDQACALATLTMTSCFAVGDLVGGLRDGLVVLGQHAHSPRVINVEQP